MLRISKVYTILVSTNTEKLNEMRKERQIKLEKKLHYGRGLTYKEWDELVELRIEWLIEKGENPDNYYIDSPSMKKREKRVLRRSNGFSL